MPEAGETARVRAVSDPPGCGNHRRKSPVKRDWTRPRDALACRRVATAQAPVRTGRKEHPGARDRPRSRTRPPRRRARARCSRCEDVGFEPRATWPSWSRREFVVTGHGWGHGIGLSQWGTYGYAKAGVTYPKILAHYYPHTTLGPAPLRRVRVLLTQNAASVVIASDDDMHVKDANGDSHTLAGGSYTLKPGLKLPVDARAKPQKLDGPLTFAARSQPLSLGGRAYRGQLRGQRRRLASSR